MSKLIDVSLTREQIELLADVVDDAMAQARRDCWIFEPGDKDWQELVSRAKALQGVLSELESV